MAKKKGMTCVKFDKQPEGTNYIPGTYSWVADSSADQYIQKGYGVEHDPEETRRARKKETRPTNANTVKQIKKWLDEQGVEYGDENKPELLELVNSVV